MIVFTGSDNPNEWERKSLRGYAVEVSLDKFRWEEVEIIHEIGINNADEGGYDYAIVDFPDEWARYLAFKVTEVRKEMPMIGEVAIFGVGYAYEGEYDSGWLDFGTPTVPKNFNMVTWDGEIPEGTSLGIQTKTAYMLPDETLVESPWSTPTSVRSFELESPEPATMIEYRLKLSTQDINKTPVMKNLKINYSEDAVNVPVSNAGGYIVPEEVPMGVDTTFVYTLNYDLNSGENIKYLEFSVPGESILKSVYCTDTKATLTNGSGVTYSSTLDTLYVAFTTPVTDSDKSGADSLYVSFDTKLLKNVHDFTAKIYNSTMNDNAGGVKVWENLDLGYWTVTTSSIFKGILSNVKAVPKVFTPNGDNTNDFAVIEFTLAKLEEINLKIKIYDTRGSLVTTVFDDQLRATDWFVKEKSGNAALAKTMPGYWDGTDEDGDLVPPGVYLFQIVADTDDGEKIESGSVAVAY